jgi:hypothetical protein
MLVGRLKLIVLSLTAARCAKPWLYHTTTVCIVVSRSSWLLAVGCDSQASVDRTCRLSKRGKYESYGLRDARAARSVVVRVGPKVVLVFTGCDSSL